LTVGIALMAGMAVQIVSQRLSLPAIVLLLAAGVGLGPDGLSWVHADSLGDGLHILVSFSVAVILFDGALNLHIRKLRHQGPAIRRLVSLGAVITAVGGALAARWIMDWNWRLSALFGTLVMVTGPTVITPLLRRLRVSAGVSTVLEAEGIFIDAIGAVVAVVALEVVLLPPGSAWGAFALGLIHRWGVGLLVGSIGGWILARGLSSERLVPEEFANVFTLAMVLGIFQISGALASESGVVASITAGLIVGHSPSANHRELRAFKEQLTSLLLGMLFVLLAADVRLSEIHALGWRGVGVVALLIGVVRPLCAWASTQGTKLSWKERAFIGWLAPRGIVAAAVASFFALRLHAAGMEGGNALRALVFLVIGMTVVLAGIAGGSVARALGVQRPPPAGYLIFGANALARMLGRALEDAGQSVVMIDFSSGTCRQAQEAGFQVVFGDALEERTLQRAQADTKRGLIAATLNEGLNLIFAQRVQQSVRGAHTFVAIDRMHMGIRPEHIGPKGSVLFGAQRDLEQWALRAERSETALERWQLSAPQIQSSTPPSSGQLEEQLLPLVVERDAQAVPYDTHVELIRDDIATFALTKSGADEARAWLTAHGWTLAAAKAIDGEATTVQAEPVPV
jgi:NhaP-type Na+/H+ or K+/H+ antiporter